MLEIYMSDKTLEKIWLESPNSNWGKILSKQQVIYVSLENPNRLFDAEDELSQISAMNDIRLEPSTAYIESVISGVNSISEKPFGVFILDIEPHKALKMQMENGVICMSSDKIDDDILTLIDPCVKEYEDGEFGDWTEILSGIKAGAFVSNSIVINDRNLFANDGQKMNRYTKETYEDTTGVENVSIILNEIIPHTLNVPYHVTILCDYECVNNGLTHKSVAEKINKIKKMLNRQFPIEMEILFIKRGDKSITDATHNRRIVSNYFILKADHKICAFKTNHKRRSISTCGQTISIDKLYSKGILDRSDPPAKGHKVYVNKYKTIVNTLKESERRGFVNCYFAQNGQEKPITELQNRLLI